MSHLGHLGLVEGFGDQEGRFDGHNRTRCVRICVRHGPVPAAHLGVFRGFSTVRQGCSEPHSPLAVRPARLWHRDRHAVAAGWVRGAAVAGARPCSGWPPWRTSARWRCATPTGTPTRYAAGALVLLMIAWTGATAIGVRPPGLAALAAAAGRPRRGRGRRAGHPVGGRPDGARRRRAHPGGGLAGRRRCWPGRSPAAGGGARSPRCWSARRDLAIRERIGQSSLTGAVLLLLAGVVVGHVARLAGDAEERLQRAVELEAATRERERLARGHPRLGAAGAGAGPAARRRAGRRGRRAGPAGRRAGGGAARAGRRRRRDRRAAGAASAVDLRTLLGRYASATVSLAAPATPVPLPGRVAGELAAAVGARWTTWRGTRAGRAWVLVEDEAGDGDRARPRRRAGHPGRAAGRGGRAGPARAWPSRSGAGSPTWAARCGSRPPPGAGHRGRADACRGVTSGERPRSG